MSSGTAERQENGSSSGEERDPDYRLVQAIFRVTLLSSLLYHPTSLCTTGREPVDADSPAENGNN